MKLRIQNPPVIVALITTVLAIASVVIVAISLYQTHLENVRLRLVGLAKTQAHQVIALDRYLHNHYEDGTNDSNPSRIDTKAIIHVLHLHGDVGESASLVVAQRNEAGFEILASDCQKHSRGEQMTSESELSEPMRRALRGESGVYEGMMCDGRRVLAAYEPIYPPNLGLFVAQDLYEIQDPFYRAGSVIMLLIFLLMGSSYFISKRLYGELIRDTKEKAVRLEEEILARKSAELSLTRSEERFRLAAQTVTDLIYEWNPVSDELLWFGDVDGALGYDSGDFPHTMQAWMGLIHPDDSTKISEEVEHHRESGGPINMEYRVRRKDGQWRIWKDQGFALVDDEGRPMRLIGACTDITESKEANEALHKSETRYRKLFESMTSGVAVHEIILDENRKPHDYRFLEVNQAFEDITGLNGEDIIGKTVLEILPQTERFWIETYGKVALTGESVRFENYAKAHEKYYQVAAYSNRPGQFVTVFEDITERKQQEVAIRTKTNQLLNAIRIAKLGHWQYDVLKDEFTFSDEFYALFGTTAEAQGGYTMSSARYAQSFVYPDDAPLVGAEVQKALETKDPNYSRRLEHRVVFGDGTIGQIAVRFQVEMSSEGRVVKTYGMNQDITERFLQEKAIRESESKLRQIFENSGEGILIVDLDEHIIMANSAAHRIFGVEVGELIGKDIREFIVPDQRSAMTEYTQNRLEGKSSTYELMVQRPDGEHRHIITTASPWRDFDGKIIGSCGVLRDVTTRERAIAETRAARKMLQDVIDSMPGTVFWKDLNSQYLGCNQLFSELAGLKSPEEVVGKSDYDLPWTKEESDSYRECDRRVMQNDEPEVHIVEPQLIAEGKETWVDTSKIPLHDDNGNVIGILGLYHDITEEVKSKQERQRFEDQLRQTQKLETIGTLAGGIAHDFNNILVPILVTSQMLLDETEKDTQIFEDVEQINIAAKRARDLVKHILTFSRQTEGEKINIDLTQIVKEVVKLLQSSLPSTIVLNYSIDSDCGRVIADPTQIHQVLMNLCTNAYQAIGEKEGRIDVRLGCMSLSAEQADERSLTSGGRFIALSVQDTGSGIDPKILAHIFDPFFTTKEVGKGTGLGLSVAHGIAKNHGGTILVESEPGKGSLFTVYLPMVESVVESRVEPEHCTEGGNEHVLVVDDDLEVAEMAQRILERLGYQVTVRTSSIECIEAFKANPDKYDIVLSDQIMPNMTGDQMMSRIRDIRPDIPSVVMTGFSTKVTEENYHSFGFDEFIMKPMVPQQLNNAVRNALTRRAEKNVNSET